MDTVDDGEIFIDRAVLVNPHTDHTDQPHGIAAIQVSGNYIGEYFPQSSYHLLAS